MSDGSDGDSPSLCTVQDLSWSIREEEWIGGHTEDIPECSRRSGIGGSAWVGMVKVGCCSVQ